MTDYRCPCCNRPVSGKQDVTLATNQPKAKQCQHCKTAIEAKKFTDDVGTTWGFEEKGGAA